ncbi:hypothetical protein TWF281_000334 [Arthrobotrys megalospora]
MAEWRRTRNRLQDVVSVTPTSIPNLDTVKKFIERHQDICRERCGCNTNTGRIMERPNDKSHNCDTIFRAGRCMLIYACFCMLRLGQPKVPEDQLTTPLQEFQDAINQLPAPFRNYPPNENWGWVVDPRIAQYPGQVLRYNLPEEGGGDDLVPRPGGDDFRVNVAPDEEPPFFLEGPNEYQDPDQDDGGVGPSNWYLQPGRMGGGSGSGGGVYRKREAVEPSEGEVGEPEGPV